MAAVVVLSLVLVSTLFLADLSDRLVVVVAIGSWMLINVPLLIIDPITPRISLPSYALLLLMVVSVLTSNFGATANARSLAVVTAVVACAGLLVWHERVAVYDAINQASVVCFWRSYVVRFQTELRR